MNNKTEFTYILLCSDGSFYTGYTNNLRERVIKHNKKKGAKYTKGRNPVFLKYFEEFTSKNEALKKEAAIKKLKKINKKKYIDMNITKEKQKIIDVINEESR